MNAIGSSNQGVTRDDLTAGYVRSILPPHSISKSDFNAMLIFCGCFTWYLLTFWAIVLVPFWPIIVFSILLQGLAIGSLFVIGHDACHGSFTSAPLLNGILGRIAFLPSFHPFTTWNVAHNQLHHGYTNFKGQEDIYVPLSKAEFDALSVTGKYVQQFYRTHVGLVFYYLIEVWVKRLLIPGKRGIRGQSSLIILLDIGLIAGYFVAEIIILAWLVPVFNLHQSVALRSAVTKIFLTLVIPYSVWLYLYVIIIFQHHNNPRVPWFDKESEWTYFNSQIRASVHLVTPRFVGFLMNDILEHTAHHADVRIPLYRLRESQKALELSFPESITVQTGLFKSLFRTLKICKLYDYDEHQWLDFSGKPTTCKLIETSLERRPRLPKIN